VRSRLPRVVRTAVGPPLAVALLAAGLASSAFLLGGCAKLPIVGKKALKVELRATPDCNSCGRPTGYPLTFRVLQVTDPSLLSGMTLTQLWDKEEKLLGPAMLKKTEGIVDPGRSIDLPVEKQDGATAMVIVGHYCQVTGSCWYYVHYLSKGGSVKLKAGPDCLAVAK
jgi:type VI secretion system VasD/TssJ family lipoprotein